MGPSHKEKKRVRGPLWDHCEKDATRRVEAAQLVASHDGEVCPAKWKQGQATLKPSIDLVGKI